MKLLTADEVLSTLKDKDAFVNINESEDSWHESEDKYINALFGWRVNLIGSEYADIEEGSYKCVVSSLHNGIDTSEVIFEAIIKEDNAEYVFDGVGEIEAYIDTLFGLCVWNKPTIKEMSTSILVMNEIRDIKYEYELDDTFGLECEMREVSYSLAMSVLEKGV
ncbi:MAG: Unknown protein [uncultured Sulfurovum sp.]|uniref:Uncharacterized protein n=1 Tax=uncultured Sulfurovum sp. TaxID=269237 RepID=A0A6S6SQV2_9BACT|nr:MAG: Unknown protein [uncultured Sulfurovum sp.]